MMRHKNIFSERSILFTTRSTWLIGGTLLQFWQFRLLEPSQFVYISVANLAAGIISQFDLGFSNLFVSNHLENSNITNNYKDEQRILFSELNSHRKTLIILFSFWTLLSIFFALWPVIFDQTPYALQNVHYLISIVGLSLSSVSAFLSKLISTLGKRIELQIFQLCTILIQIVLFAIYRNFIIAILNLLVFPILIISYWIYLNSNIASQVTQESKHEMKPFMLNLRLQSVQIIGLTVTVITPFIAIFYLNTTAAAASQLLLKFAAVLVTLGSAFYLTIQRDSYKLNLKEYFLQIRIAIMMSFIFSTVLILIILAIGLLESLGAEQPNMISYFTFIGFVSLQPFNISLYFLVMRNRGYGTLIVSGLSNLTILIFLAILLISHIGIDAVYPSIFCASLVSALPMVLKLRAIKFFKFTIEGADK